MTEWIPLLALPNIEIRNAIGVEKFALASEHDERITKIASTHKNFERFLRSFSDEFGARLVPSILIYRADAPHSYRTVEAITGFRDAIAMSIIPRTWARRMVHGHSSGVQYSDYFISYPWMVDKDYDHLVTNSLNMAGLHDVQLLRAQGSPALPRHVVDQGPIDEPLLSALLARWEGCFSGQPASHDDVRLFRSLNMSNAAARLPAQADATQLDIGRAVALWASAFEILSPSQSAAYLSVYDLLAKNTWHEEACKEPIYKAHAPRNDPSLRSLPCWIYGQIYLARNDFLHGNPVDRGRLTVSPAQQSVYYYAAILYRMALAAFIDLREAITPNRDGETEFETYMRQYGRFGRYQEDIETALASIMHTTEEFRRISTGRLGRVKARKTH